MLKNNKYELEYCSIDCDVDSQFFIPSYKESTLLNRGSGYFTLKSLIMDIDGIIPFIENDGHIHLICNPELSPEDISLIDMGTSLAPEQITRRLLEEVTNQYNFSTKELDALDIICNMIAEKRLEIKIAYMPLGIYHEKNGIFIDSDGNKVCYSGSLNETVCAKKYNYEQIDVYTSWTGDVGRIAAREMKFQKLWDNQAGERINVVSFPEAVQTKLFDEYRKSPKLEQAIQSFKNNENKSHLSEKTLFPYQEQAIKEFVKNGYRHFYEMATGTGKTFTSVRTIEKVIEDKKKAFVIVIVFQKDLQVQWEEALVEDGFKNIYFAGGVASERPSREFRDAVISYMTGDDVVICISVDDTFFDKVYGQLNKIENLFVIVDEAHNLTPQQVRKLPANPSFKLGLSATAERFTKTETEIFLKYFTDGNFAPFYYGIEEAIEKGFLSKYEYYTIFVHISDDKFEQYKVKSKKIAGILNQKVIDQEALSRYRRERSLIIKQEPNKLNKLQEMTAEYDFVNSVVYCGQGKDSTESIINAVSTILNSAGYRVHHFTSKTEDRDEVKKLFSADYYDTLIAIRCLDEGVDIPKLGKIYIMASDTAKRQTIQRRGRVLRKCKATGKDIAYIYDMVLLPPKGVQNGGGIKSLIVSEFTRVNEYNRLALNKDANQQVIDQLLDYYNVTQEDFNNEQESI